jgi:hypothetical protein
LPEGTSEKIGTEHSNFENSRFWKIGVELDETLKNWNLEWNIQYVEFAKAD